MDVVEDHEVATLLKARSSNFELTTITVDNEEDIDEIRALFSSPVQEFTAATLKSSYKRSDWEELVAAMRGDKGSGRVSGFLSVVLGQDVQNNEGYVLLSGWNTYEVRRRARKLCSGSDEVYRRPIWRRSARRLDTVRTCFWRWISGSSTPISLWPREAKRACVSRHVPPDRLPSPQQILYTAREKNCCLRACALTLHDCTRASL